MTACFGEDACNGVPPRGFLYKAPAQHSDKQLVSEGSVYFRVNTSPLEVMEGFEQFILRRKQGGFSPCGNTCGNPGGGWVLPIMYLSDL